MSQIVTEDNFYDDGYDDDERVCDNRIEFSKTRMYGREEELRSLHEIYRKICSKKSSTEVVLVSGYSGTGKSALVRRLAEEIIQQASLQNNNNNKKKNDNGSNSTTTSAGIAATAPSSSRSSSMSSSCASVVSSSSSFHNATTPPPPTCLFLTGKFDDLQSADPFSAIIQAFSGFAHDLLNNPDADEFQRVRRKIVDAVGSEGKVLTDLIPSLSLILSDPPDKKKDELGGGHSKNGDRDSSNHSKSTTDSSLGVWSRLTYIFQKFVRAICTEERVVLLFLDDLQWADTPSLDLIASLICDSPLQNFMLVGALRSNEVDEGHPLHQHFIRVVEKKKTIQQLELRNLSLEHVNLFISDTLGLELCETLALTRALYSKTRGNIFFTIQALEEWNQRNVIYHSAITFQWEWNLQEVELAGARLSDDVVGVVAAKIRRAPDLLQKALTIASYTRSTFDVDTLHSLLEVVGNYTIERQELLRLLDTAVLESLLTNVVGSKEYTFAHDRIQQAAYFLVPVRHDRDSLRERIGMFMLERGFSDIGQDWMLFIAADHLNYSIDKQQEHQEHQQEQRDNEHNNNNNNNNNITTNSNNNKEDHCLDPIELAKLNLEVGKKSMLVAAFNPASRYLRMAQKLVFATEYPWEHQYELTLRLVRAVMDVELALGNYETGHCLGQLLLDNAKATDDALPTYRTFALALARQERNREAVELCMIALDVLCKFPKRFYILHVMVKAQTVKKLLKNHSDEDILYLPKMIDEKLLLTSEFLYECSRQAFFCGNLFQALFCTLRNIELSFEHGLCSFHCHAYLLFSIFMRDHYGETQMGFRLSNLAKEILKKHDENKEIQSSFYLSISTSFDSWNLPAAEVLKTFRRGHIAGMQGGDIDFGFRNWMFQIYYGFMLGYPLQPIEQAGSQALEQVLRYKIDGVSGILLEMMFLFRHLIGVASSTTSTILMEGEDSTHNNTTHTTSSNGNNTSSLNNYNNGISIHLDWEKIKMYGIERRQDVNEGDGMKLLQGLLSRLQLAVYFDQLPVAEKLSSTVSNFFEVDQQYHIITIRVFFRGLMALGLLRKTRKKKYQRLAQKMVSEMKKLAKARGNNSCHRYLLLEADLKSYSSAGSGSSGSKASTEKVASHVSLYDKAISSALDIGCTQDAALGSELAGKHFLSSKMGSKEQAKKYILQAQGLYHDWGAMKKVEHLQNRYGSSLLAGTQAQATTAKSKSSKHARLLSNNARHHNSKVPFTGLDLLSGI